MEKQMPKSMEIEVDTASQLRVPEHGKSTVESAKNYQRISAHTKPLNP